MEEAKDQAILMDKLNELVNEVGGGAGSYIKLAILAQQARQSNSQLQKNISELQDAMDFLRVCIKYQTFDLEATRRENVYLRKLLEEKNS